MPYGVKRPKAIERENKDFVLEQGIVEAVFLPHYPPMDNPAGAYLGRELELLVSIQFPISDARQFGSQPNIRLNLPDWPEPKTSINPQFVHYFGKATERLGDPDEAWPDELKFVQATRGIRFDRLETHHIGQRYRRFKPRCAFRRLFSDGRAVVRAEIGISHKRTACPLKNLSLQEILCIARGTAEIPTMVPSVTDEPMLRPLLVQGKYLARLYANASMDHTFSNETSGLQLVEAGDPVILVELTPGEADLDSILPSTDGLTVLKSSSINGAKALFCRLNTKAGIVSTWIIQKGKASNGQLRSLRLCLTRLHAEREVLDLILKQLHRRRIMNHSSEESVDLLDQYFNDRLKIINRDSWGGMKQSEIVAAFDATKEVVRAATQEQLIRRYDGGRKQVWKKIQAYQDQRFATRTVHVVNVEEGAIMIDKQVNVSGTGHIVNVAEYMSNVTNTVNNNLSESGAGKEVKDLVKELTLEIKRVASEAEPGQVKKMGKNLEALSNEIASDEPEQRWYQVSIEGILEAAKAVGSIAEPVISVAKKLSVLLLA